MFAGWRSAQAFCRPPEQLPDRAAHNVTRPTLSVFRPQKPDGSAHLCLLPATEGERLLPAQAKLTAELGRLLGAIVTAESVALIAPEDSGKFRLTLRVA